VQQCWVQIRWANAVRSSIPLVAIILVGCDTSADPPGVASSKFDGPYVGAMELTTKNNPACSTPYPFPRMVIVNGKLEYRHFGNGAIFHIMVHDDGSFSGSGFSPWNKQRVTFEGKVVGKSIEADTENPYCKYHMTLKRE
jgi:hypothetical protein